jgi:competence protein ComEC
MLINAVSFILGIVGYYQCGVWSYLFFFLLLIAGVCYKKRIWFAMLVFFLMGIATFHLSFNHYQAHLLPHSLEKKTVTVEGIIVTIPVTGGRRSHFEFQAQSLQFEGKKIKWPRRLMLSWYYPKQHPRAAEHWRLSVRLKRPHGLHNPGGFSFEHWCMLHGISAKGYIYAKGHNHRLSQAPSFSLLHWREVLWRLINKKISDIKIAGLVGALSIGVKSGVDKEIWKVFRLTGTSHLMAISGLHVGIMAGLFFFIFAFVWRWIGWGLVIFPDKVIGAVGGILFAILYSALAGFSVSTLRADIMLSTMMGAMMIKRQYKPWHGLSLAALCVLLFNPFNVLSPGFWLSFIAVAMILWVSVNRLRLSQIKWKSVRAQGAIFFGLFPVCLYLFQQNSLISPFANAIVIPWMGVAVIPFAVLGVLISFVSSYLSFIVLGWVCLNLKGVLFFLTLLSHLPLASLTFSIPVVWIACLALLGLMILLLPKGLSIRFLGIFYLFPLIFYRVPHPKTGTFQVTMLDVGQGLSVVLQTANHVLVYDTGGSVGANDDMGQRVLLPYFNAQHMTHFDMLMISHGDDDHIGGAHSLLSMYPADRILTSVPKRFKKAEQCLAGQHWQWDGVNFKVLYPNPNYVGLGNNSSCVLKVTAGLQSVLLTGDIEKKAEAYLVEHEKTQLKSTLLIAPHHGSKTSSTLRFLQAVNPKEVWFSTGYLNRFHFPAKKIVGRYNQMRVKQLNTAKSGAIVMVLK